MPSPSSLYVDPSLAGVSVARAKNAWIAGSVFNEFPVKKQAGVYFVSDPNRRRFAPVDDARVAGAEPKRYDNEDPTTAAYLCEDHALEGFVTDEERENADEAARAEVTTTEDVVDMLMLNREIELVTLMQTISQAGTPGTLWDVANGDTIADILAQKETIAQATGRQPNEFITTQQILDKVLTKQTAFAERVKYTLGPDAIHQNSTAELIRKVCGLSKVHVGESWKNTAARGASAVMTRIWGKHSFLFYNEPARIRTQALGITFTWNPSGGARGGFEVATERVEKRKGDAVYVHNYRHQKLINATAGYYFTSVIS